MSILQKLHEDEEARDAFHKILLFLEQVSTPDEGLTEDDVAAIELEFLSHLDALIHLKRQSVQEGDVKIGHWCCMESEKDVEGMDSWPVYWLTLKDESVEGGTTKELDLSIWASGKDDNTILKGIESWVKVHFPIWTIKRLQCVRR